MVNSPFSDGGKAPKKIPTLGATADLADFALPVDDAPQLQGEAPAAVTPRKRPPQAQFGRSRMKLPSVPPRSGYYRYWFLDTKDKLSVAQSLGYTMVNKTDGTPFSAPGGFLDGHAVKMYCMEIPEEWHNDDVGQRQQRLDEQDELIYGGKNNEELDDKRYVPSTGIKIGVQRGSGRG